MGEVSGLSTGLLTKISLLFNNPLYSDVEFNFMSSTGQNHRMYGHKLILALRSKAFAEMFFEMEKSVSSFNLPASKLAGYEQFLRFMYTDAVEFHTFTEARDLYDLAVEFKVEELANKCHKYLLQDKLTIKNLFSKYEDALKRKDGRLLEDCRNFVCSKTEQVLEAGEFATASPEVIRDIVQQDNLSLHSELNIIMAILNWGQEDLSRKRISCDEKHLRESVNPFVKYLRFLTLTASEFEYLVENRNIFTALESNILTRKILQPGNNINLPENICCITAKRKTKTLSKNSPVSEFVGTPPAKLSHEIKKYSAVQETKVSVSKLKQTKFCSSPNISNDDHLKTIFSSSSVFTTSQSPWRAYSFPLNEIDSSLFTSFRNEVVSSITFKMKRGNLSLHGIELKIMNNKSMKTEELKVFVDFQGFSKPLSQMYPKELSSNNLLTIKFKNNMILRQGCKGVLEVSIDDLLLNRCCSCNIQEFELNNGLEFACELNLKSNKKSDSGGFYFLVNKLIYALVK